MEKEQVETCFLKLLELNRARFRFLEQCTNVLKKKTGQFALRAQKTSNKNKEKNRNQFAQAKEHGVLENEKKTDPALGHRQLCFQR
jgi:hypothetical protein